MVEVIVREVDPQTVILFGSHARGDARQFWQIHRSTIVDLSAISALQRDEMGRQRVAFKQHKEALKVSRSFGHVFKHQ